MEHPLGTKSVDSPAINSRRSPRALIKTEVISIIRRIIERPEPTACLGIQAFDLFLVPGSMKQNQSVARHDRAAEPLSNLPLPEDGQTGLRQRVSDIGRRVVAVPSRAEKLRPVFSQQ